MGETYQTGRAEARVAPEVVVPETVTIALGEVAGSVKEVVALAVGAGLQLEHSMRKRHQPGRYAPSAGLLAPGLHSSAVWTMTNSDVRRIGCLQLGHPRDR